MKIKTLAEFEEALKNLTPFQRRVMDTIEKSPWYAADYYEIARSGFAEEWKRNRSSHGALIRAIILACRVLDDEGLVTTLEPKGKNGTYTYCSRRKWMKNIHEE